MMIGGTAIHHLQRSRRRRHEAQRIKRPHLGRRIKRHRAARIAMSVITASLRGRAMAVRLRLHRVRANLS